MRLLITGGTGFIGSVLCKRLLAEKHHLVVLTRSADHVKEPIQAITDLAQLADKAFADGFDGVINLAGEPIANKRWSVPQKQRIVSSRIDITQTLVDYFQQLEARQRPRVFISGSAIGYYGVGKSEQLIDETATGDDSFSSQLCQQWEATALVAQTLGIRTCVLRTGIVLGKNGGALNKMLPPFKMGLGGRMGSGKQWMSWIHQDDLIGIIVHCMTHTHVHGAINGTAPMPVTNSVFTQILAKTLKRPAIFPMPAMLIKLLMGQMGEELLLAGKRIVPKKALETGYCFHYETCEEALLAVVND